MARIITDLKELSKLFIYYCDKYQQISFVTAWAGKSNAVIDALYRNKDKIVHSSVGLQFYQTAPEFIDRFWEVEDIQYCKNKSTDIIYNIVKTRVLTSFIQRHIFFIIKAVQNGQL